MMYDINHTEYVFEIYEPRAQNNGYMRNTSLELPNSTADPNTTWTDHEGWCSTSVSSGEFLTTPLFQACVYFMYCTVFVVALVGNGLVCFVVQTSPRMKTVTNYFIVNLAVGDILMTLFCVPFSFVSMLVLRYWPFGAVMCKVVNYSQAVSVLVSAYTLLAISIDRYMAIMRPLRPRLGKAAAKLVVAAVWGGALATAAPIPVVSTLQRPTDWYQFCEADICLEQWERVEQSSQYTCALLALQFALPLGALVCTYARIAAAVWGGRPPGEAQSARDSRMQRSKRKMIKMMVMVVAVFTICWLPLNVFIVLWTGHESDAEWGAWPGMPYVWFASHWLAMSHSCYNPIIYFYMILNVVVVKVLWTAHESDAEWGAWPGMPYVWFASHWLAMSHSCYNPIIYCYMILNVVVVEVLWTAHESDAEWGAWPGMPYVWFASHWLAMSHSCYNPIIYCYMNARYRRGFKQALGGLLCMKLDGPSRSCHRSSMGDGMPMSEMVGMNGITRRGTLTSCASRLQRAPTCSSCASSLRRVPPRAAPVRALSVRTHFN